MIGDPWVFVIFTFLLMGGAGVLAGQALAASWRSVWQVAGYGILLGVFDRFLVFALFEGELLSFAAYLTDTAVIVACALIAYRVTRTRRMIEQYPWPYVRSSPVTWRNRSDGQGEAMF